MDGVFWFLWFSQCICWCTDHKSTRKYPTMPISQLFKVLLTPDDSSMTLTRRVSKLTRKYCCNKKTHESSMNVQSVSSWVCPECLYKNKHYVRCMGCNIPKLSSSGLWSVINIRQNHPAAAVACGHGGGGRSGNKTPPPACQSLSQVAKTSLSCLAHFRGVAISHTWIFTQNKFT